MRRRDAAAVCVCLMALAAAPAPAEGQLIRQFRDNVNIRLNNRLTAGTIVDFTHNHGTDRRLYSTILGMPRDLYVYLPPGYDPAYAYPLILHFHMASVDEHNFLSVQLRQLDRMIRRGQMPPVIVASPDGTYSGENSTTGRHSLFVNGRGGRVEDHIMEEVIPFLMTQYSVRPERQAHALLGTSAGGFGAMSLAMRRRDVFGAVATMGAPVNMRYSNINGRYAEDFDPFTYRWQTRYDPEEVAGRFYFGLRQTPARKHIEPVFGKDPGVVARIAALNPADLLFTSGIQPGELAMFVHYPGRDNYNFDAQAESFAWLAASRGIVVETHREPLARHNIVYFDTNHKTVYRWLGRHLLPPTGSIGIMAE